MIENIFKPLNNNLNSLLPIGFDNVSLKLGKNYFFKKLSFIINTKGITAFIGPNGTGKSSCIKLLTGLITPESGEIFTSLNSKKSIFPDKRFLHYKIGYVPQKIILLRRSVENNLLHTLSVTHYPANDIKERIKEIMKFAKLEHLAKNSARRLSVGQQQLLSIMRALIIRPQFLFLDEPCVNLDPKTTLIIEDILKVVSSFGVKIIIVTHDLFQAKRLADDILFFHDGKILEQSKTKDFFKKPKSKEAKDFRNGLL